MAALTSQLIVSLIDRVTGPAKAVGNSVASLNNRLRAATAAQGAAVGRLQSQMFGAVGAGFTLQRALAAPISIASKFESSMLDIGQKADLSDEAISSLADRIRALAPVVNKSAADVAKGMDTLVGFGLDPEQAEKLLAPIGKTATAYNASIDDLSKSSFATLDNLKVKAEDLGKALDVMAQSGKSGAFELKDMAAEFPSLTASAQALQMTGVTAVGRLTAALQIMRKGASSGSEAATNAANIMQKIISPETTKKFTKLGVDIRKELKKVQKDGGDVFEMIAEVTNRALKGDLSKLGDLFQDAQVQKGLTPLIQNLKEYRKIRDEALAASGIVDKDFQRRMLTNAALTDSFKIRIQSLGMTIGKILIPTMNSLMDRFAPLVETLDRFAKAHPELVGGAIKVTAGLIALRVASIGARYAMAFLGAAALSSIAPLRLIPAALALASAGMVALMRPLALVTAALRLLKLAVIGTGIGAALIAIGAAGTFIYNNWQGLGNFFSSFFASLKSNLDSMDGGRFKGLSDIVDSISQTWAKWTGAISDKTWSEAGTSAGNSMASAIRSIADAIDAVMQKWEGFKAAWNAVQDVLQMDAGKAFKNVMGGGKSTHGRASLSDAGRERLNVPVIGGNSAAPSVWSNGASPVEHLDQSGFAGAAATKSAAAYTANFEQGLKSVDPIIAAAMSRWMGMLGSFSASPTISPKFGPASSQKSASIDGIRARQQTAFADYGFKTV